MKKMRIKTLITIPALVAALVSCSRETAPEQSRLVTIPLSMEQPAADPETKVYSHLNTGALSWTDGDKISVYITGSGEFKEVAVNASAGTIYLSLTGTESLDEGYSLYPSSAVIEDHGTGATPWITYPKAIDLSEASEESGYVFVKAPLMAKNSLDGLKFYQVGGALRLSLSNVPSGTKTIRVTFNGMTDVVGICAVTDPGTPKATTAIVSGEGAGNVITFSNYTSQANIMVPLPSIDFTGLTSILVEAFDESSVRLRAISKTNNGSWGTLKHGHARVVAVDFTEDLLNSVRMETTAVTLWRSQTVQRKATPIFSDGMPYKECTLVWSTSSDAVATVNATTGVVAAVSAGTAVITATATADVDGQVTVKSASFTVNVNEVTGVVLASTATSLANGEQATLTATVTHTNNGVVDTYPTGLTQPTFESNDSNVTVSDLRDFLILTGTSFKVTNVASCAATTSGTATITVTVPAKYCTGGVSQTDDVDIVYAL